MLDSMSFNLYLDGSAYCMPSLGFIEWKKEGVITPPFVYYWFVSWYSFSSLAASSFESACQSSP